LQAKSINFFEDEITHIVSSFSLKEIEPAIAIPNHFS